MSAIAPLPCVYCGRDVSVDEGPEGFWTSCATCGAEGPTAPTRDDAVQRANTPSRARTAVPEGKLAIEMSVAVTSDLAATGYVRWSAFGSSIADAKDADGYARQALGELLPDGLRTTRVQAFVYLPDPTPMRVVGQGVDASDVEYARLLAEEQRDLTDEELAALWPSASTPKPATEIPDL